MAFDTTACSAVIGDSNKKDCGCVAIYYPVPPAFCIQNHILNILMISN